ncbi:hypothetical protein BDR05DRAFT_346158 [Suillus weaverae]|nr:hypothetical protein BDR05DRAFT_346158 [Suillus weaverae]
MTYPLHPDYHFKARRPSRPHDSSMRKALLFVSESRGYILLYHIPLLSHCRHQPARSHSSSYTTSVYPQFLSRVTVTLIQTPPFRICQNSLILQIPLILVPPLVQSSDTLPLSYYSTLPGSTPLPSVSAFTISLGLAIPDPYRFASKCSPCTLSSTSRIRDFDFPLQSTSNRTLGSLSLKRFSQFSRYQNYTSHIYAWFVLNPLRTNTQPCRMAYDFTQTKERLWLKLLKYCEVSKWRYD